MKPKKEIKFDIENGPVFHTDEVSIIHNPLKIILDFKNITPRVDIRNNEFQPIVIKHSVVVMDTWTAKNFSEALMENISMYEKKFGEIKKPKVIELAEKNAKKKGIQKKEMPAYFG